MGGGRNFAIQKIFVYAGAWSSAKAVVRKQVNVKLVINKSCKDEVAVCLEPVGEQVLLANSEQRCVSFDLSDGEHEIFIEVIHNEEINKNMLVVYDNNSTLTDFFFDEIP